MLSGIEYEGHRVNRIEYQRDDLNGESCKQDYYDFYVADQYDLHIDDFDIRVMFERLVGFKPLGVYTAKILTEVRFKIEEGVSLPYLSKDYLEHHISDLMKLNPCVLADVSLLIANITGAMSGLTTITAPMVHTQEHDTEVKEH